MINNRQNGRRRGRGPQVRNGATGGGGDRGNRIDNRARGNAAQLHEKYRNLARDAQTQGDRVMTEYYLQFADHYFRVLSESRARFEEQQPRRQQGDDYDDGGDDGDSFVEDRVGNDRMSQPPRQERYSERPEPRYEQRPADRPEPRYEPRAAEQSQRRPDRDLDRSDPPRSTAPVPVAGNDATPASGDGEPPRPRRGRRPRRDGEGVQPERIDADRLAPPAFLSEGAVPAAEVAPVPDGEEAPRRTRTRRPKGGDDTVVAA